jgi:hypothetical protein
MSLVITFVHKVPRLIYYLGLGKCWGNSLQMSSESIFFYTDSVSELYGQKLYIVYKYGAGFES